ncbi:MAG TPA: AAA family ATPase [Candidatus Angelobacter sp.]|nr:AAA family ATPase [Candidatus Angelobacter sp.]
MTTAPVGSTAPQRAEVAETHVSVLTFIGDRVYKLKKPVAPGFLDFTTREARQRACHREVALNRRLAPDVYLGVADVVGPDGAMCDHLVVMRRMPAARRLSTLVAAGADVDAELRAVARTVAAFHERAARSPEIDAHATAEAVRARWDVCAAELFPLLDSYSDQGLARRVVTLTARFLAGRAALFAARIASRHVVDGHGDLTADDIFCLDDGPRILDCVEFDDRLRHVDVIDDVAFLAMDLERLGHAELAARFVRLYREYSGDTAPASLLHHYIAYRAIVRAKVARLRHLQGDAEAAAEAEALLRIAFCHAERGRVELLLVGGAPGTGKSTLSTSLGDALDCQVLRSDEVRKELLGMAHDAPAPAPYGEGAYTRDSTDATYLALLHRAEHLMRRGHAVVLDATWRESRWRHAAAVIASRSAADLVELCCEAPPDVVEKRIASRPGGRSDATVEVAERIAAGFDAWPTAVHLETTDDPAQTLVTALHAVAEVARTARRPVLAQTTRETCCATPTESMSPGDPRPYKRVRSTSYPLSQVR